MITGRDVNLREDVRVEQFLSRLRSPQLVAHLKNLILQYQFISYQLIGYQTVGQANT